MKNLIILLAATTWSLCSVTIALADTQSTPPSVTVRFADLNTNVAEGVAALYQRVRNASDSVCRQLDSPRDLARQQRHEECVHTALGNAIAMIDLPAVTAYAAARGVVTVDATLKVASNR